MWRGVWGELPSSPSLLHPFFTPSIQGPLRTGSRELGNHVWYLAVFTNINIIGLLEFHDVTQHLKILVYNNILSSITITLLWAEYSNSSIIWHLIMINILDILSSSWLPRPCGRKRNFYCNVMVIPSTSSLQKSLQKPFFFSTKEGRGWVRNLCSLPLKGRLFSEIFLVRLSHQLRVAKMWWKNTLCVIYNFWVEITHYV